MQQHCLHLNGIIKDVKLNRNTDFILKSNILYKKQNENLLLAIPNILARGIIFKLHSTQGFHFNSTHLQTQLKNLIYTKSLKTLCKQIEAECPVCILSKPKKLRKICGSARSQVYRPGECIVTDSMYLPKDRHGHCKAVLIVDAASSKLSIFTAKSLKFDSIRQIFKHFLCLQHKKCSSSISQGRSRDLI